MTQRTPEMSIEELLADIAERHAAIQNQNPLPGELRWVEHWLSADLQMLSLEARGLYSEMLTNSWAGRGRLKRVDEDEIMRLIRASPEEWARTWPKISRYWQVATDPDTKLPILVNPNQLAYYRLSLISRQASLRRAYKAAAASVQARAGKPQPRPTHRPARVPGPRHEVPPCPQCGQELMRRQSSTSGAGTRFPANWWCPTERQGFPLDDPRIYGKLSANARETVDNELRTDAAKVAATAPPKAPIPKQPIRSGPSTLETLVSPPAAGEIPL